VEFDRLRARRRAPQQEERRDYAQHGFDNHL